MKSLYLPLLFILIQLITIAISEETSYASIDPEKAKSTSFAEATRYLQKYGYFKPLAQTEEGGGEAESVETMFKSSVKKMQEFMGLEKTGVLDEKTKVAMKRPRCGNSDVQNLIDPDTGKPYQWYNKRFLTYAFIDFNPNMDKSLQKLALRQSFNRWASLSSLKFRDVTNVKKIKPDIRIGFYEKCHGDDGCFDGKYGVLAHGYYPDDGNLHFDVGDKWTYPNSKEATTDLLTGAKIDLLEIATHEIGHVLGIDHIPNYKDIMFSQYIPYSDKGGKYHVKTMTDTDKEKISEIYGQGNGVAGRGPPILQDRKDKNNEAASTTESSITTSNNVTES